MRFVLIFLILSIEACQTGGVVNISNRDYVRKSIGNLKPIDSNKSYPGKQISSRNLKPEKAFLLKKQGEAVVVTSNPNAEVNGFRAYNIDGSLYSDNKTPSSTASGALFGNDPSADGSEGDKDVFLKTTEITIEENRDYLREGSMYKDDNELSNLYKKPSKFKVGNSIDVFIKLQAEAKTDEADPKEETADALKTKLEELIPNLASDDAQKKPITKFKARILRKLPNGDLEIESYKSAINESGNKFYRFKASIPKSKYKASEQLTSNDLENIRWDEVNNGDLTQRTSMAWQDEYTLRMSGFSESLSREAQQLRKREEGLYDVKKELQTRITNLNRNRSTLSSERQRLAKVQDNLEKEMKEIESIKEEAKDKDRQISDLENKIKALEKSKEEENQQDPQQQAAN